MTERNVRRHRIEIEKEPDEVRRYVGAGVWETEPAGGPSGYPSGMASNETWSAQCANCRTTKVTVAIDGTATAATAAPPTVTAVGMRSTDQPIEIDCPMCGSPITLQHED